MTYKLGCPNCLHQIDVSAEAEDTLIACSHCYREYRVPPLPEQAGVAFSHRPSGKQRHARFNVIVSAVATMTVILSVSGMLWLRTANEVHGNISRAEVWPSDFTETGSSPIQWNEEHLLADFAPIAAADLDQFVGEYLVIGDLSEDQRRVFSTPASTETFPKTLTIARQRIGMETLNLSFSSGTETAPWNEKLAPTSARLGHGFNLVANFRPALSILGAYTVDEFRDRNVACSISSHRYFDGTIVVTQACLDQAEFARDVALSERKHLCRVISTYSLEGDTLTITKRASGADSELTRRFVSMVQCQTINARRLIIRGLSEFENAWLDGQTITLKRQGS